MVNADLFHAGVIWQDISPNNNESSHRIQLLTGEVLFFHRNGHQTLTWGSGLEAGTFEDMGMTESGVSIGLIRINPNAPPEIQEALVDSILSGGGQPYSL